MRCADEPCVKDSGLTRPPDILCKQSSPTAAAAPRALLHVAALEQVALHARVLPLQIVDLAFNSKQILDVMSELVGQHLRLRELTRRTETLLQFVVKPKIDIDLLICRAMERAGGRLRLSATRCSCMPEEHQLGVLVWNTLCLQDSSPRLWVSSSLRPGDLPNPRFVGLASNAYKSPAQPRARL
jgi:hypothetical protein